jgi:hypothetical protein
MANRGSELADMSQAQVNQVLLAQRYANSVANFETLMASREAELADMSQAQFNQAALAQRYAASGGDIETYLASRRIELAGISQAELNQRLLGHSYGSSAANMEGFVANRGFDGTSSVARRLADSGYPSPYYSGRATGTFLDSLGQMSYPSLLRRDALLPTNVGESSLVSRATEDFLLRYRTQQNTNPVDQFLDMDFRAQLRRQFDNDSL